MTLSLQVSVTRLRDCAAGLLRGHAIVRARLAANAARVNYQLFRREFVCKSLSARYMPLPLTNTPLNSIDLILSTGAACVRPRNIRALRDLFLFQGSIASIASPSILNMVLIMQRNRPYARPVCVPILAILRILSLKIARTAEKLLRRPGDRSSAP